MVHIIHTIRYELGNSDRLPTSHFLSCGKVIVVTSALCVQLLPVRLVSHLHCTTARHAECTVHVGSTHTHIANAIQKTCAQSLASSWVQDGHIGKGGCVIELLELHPIISDPVYL